MSVAIYEGVRSFEEVNLMASLKLYYYRIDLEVEITFNYLRNHPLPKAELNYHQKDFVTMMELYYFQKYLWD